MPGARLALLFLPPERCSRAFPRPRRRPRACALRRLRFSRSAARSRCWRCAGGVLRSLMAARFAAQFPQLWPIALGSAAAAVAQW